MPMNPNFLCCIGAELKNSTQQTTRMSQVYLYRSFEEETVADMLSAGFFNAAMGIIRQDDLLLLYSPNETTAKYTYARVSSVSSSGVVIERVDIEATNISVDTTGYSNLSGNNLQQIMNNLDALLTTIQGSFVKLDGTSIMTGPLKMRAGSMQGAVAAYWDGVGFFKLNSNDSVTLLASMEATDGLCPATNNTYNIGKTNYKWKDAYIARVITAVINNGYDIAVPATSGPDTFALKSEVDAAANSGSQLYTTGVWYAKMYAGTTPPSSAEVEGRNYADFSQVDSDNNPIIVIYTYTSGAWTQTATITPPANYNGYITITSKIWDISEQSGQQGGLVLWAYNTKTFTPYPKIISFESPALTGTPTTPTPTSASPNTQVANKEYVDNATANSGSGLNVGDIFLTMRNDNELNGAVECDGSTYNTTDFTGAQSIGQLLADGKVPYVSMAVYASTVAAQGWCDKFGWDGTGNVQFKVPTLSAYIWQKIQTGVVGNGSRIGLQDANNNDRSLYGWSSGANYPFVGNIDYNAGSLGGSADGVLKVNTDPTKSGMVAGSASDISQQRCMVQLATSATDEALETCTSVLADVADLKDHRVIAFQAPTAQNNYTWYRKYADGWVEQGGIITTIAGTTTINLLVSMADTNYFPIASIAESAGGIGANCKISCWVDSNSIIKTTVRNEANNPVTAKVCWEVKGVAAS